MAISFPKRGLVSSFKKDCEIFVQNGPLSLDASKTHSQLISEARLRD